MSKIQNIIIFAALALIVSSCGGRFSHPDTSKCAIKTDIDPFYKEVFSKTDASTDEKACRLENKYGEYFKAYCSGELRIGIPGDSDFVSNFNQFISYDENSEVIATCDSVYNEKITKQHAAIDDALSCMRFYFSDAKIPQNIYAHFSGFNSRFFVDSTYISFGIEHYLGSNCRYYPMLEIPAYARRNKNAENLKFDIVKALIYSNYPDLSEKDDVLSAMIYQGKVLYATAACLPNEPINKILGFTDDEMKWLKQAEKQMWGYLAEQKLLYSTNPLDRNKLVNETPFTVFFGDKSPGRAALYCAYNIICSYMDNHSDATIRSLFDKSDAQKLLIDARYIP
ncbi:MAG: hypothetical protein MJZ01_05155 [Bacteroidales bacterium]|nr:hypothetical protein [Bacteroidales bacterium]